MLSVQAVQNRWQAGMAFTCSDFGADGTPGEPNFATG